MKAIDLFVEALETRPLDFKLTMHCLQDTKLNVDYWIGNGFIFFSMYRPYKINFGFWEKLTAWRAISKWKKQIALNLMSGQEVLK